MLGLTTTKTVNRLVNAQKDRISSLVALQLAITPKVSLNKKIKFSNIPFLNYTIFKNMIPFKLDEDGNETDERDCCAKVTIKDLLNKIDP